MTKQFCKDCAFYKAGSLMEYCYNPELAKPKTNLISGHTWVERPQCKDVRDNPLHHFDVTDVQSSRPYGCPGFKLSAPPGLLPDLAQRVWFAIIQPHLIDWAIKYE